MEIRPISISERKTADKIASIAFAFTGNFENTENQEKHDEDDKNTGRAVFDDNGKMCSCLELLPYIVMFNGKAVPMSGIGGVATLPEEVGKKYAQSLLTYCLQEMYEQGDVFSYLFPFSHVYYRKFGYEVNMKVINYSISLDPFRSFKRYGSMKLHLPKENQDYIKNLYNSYIQDKNLAMVRKEDRWERFFDKEPFKDNVYIYVLYNAKDEPRGYLKYSVNKKAIDNKDMVVSELIWLDFEALSGILAFIAGHAPQYRTVKWRAPDFLDLKILFPEPYMIDSSLATHGMNRIVNVPKCFELLDVPENTGAVTIEVIDDCITSNTGKYCISWENGCLDVTKSQKEPDISCKIQGLSQLATGFATPRQLHHMDKIQLLSNQHSAEKLFRKKELFINDGF